ncbi:TetR/AcrR family transcriptional regulator C-terminal domain-containing protein [Micromonospora endophytica]|uniref:TetR family transcriptional regulator n=1 Tax=Micromonospora endophytica TaxID=515350 RepID=A0A2W2C0I3_9ACTN|nr:TetR/AcrR family transcriptional regulator C-terminal domain-containing protein [Micromonospora endophytica]PZF93095.1 TetR family transcriptional regulator [Micromonospora endophytica]RIW45401.1 TetR family transcriptional regulator [Micromonospora endophytica]BCJ58527.1 TetR family transcriptional regulator [Micromonospora endophytica]
MSASEFRTPSVPGRSSRGPGSVWLRPDERPPRRNRLSRERIIAAAVALLDAEGVAGLTMRRLAQQLAVTSTALYWHVATRDDVLDLAVDEIFAEVRLPAAGGDWRADVRALTGQWRTVMLRHPWAPGLVGRPMLGPNVLARTEFLQSALVRGGFTGVRLAVTVRLLANYVIGAALTEATWRQSGPEARAQARRRITSDPTAYPTLVASGHLDDQQWGDEVLFTRGVEAILAVP